MSINTDVKQGLMYGLRPTVGKTHSVAVTAVQATFAVPKPGIWLIQNMGPDICNIRMFPASGGTFAVTTDDMPLSPIGSGDRSSIEVMITPKASERNNLKVGPNVLYAICAAGKTATLKLTQLTRHS